MTPRPRISLIGPSAGLTMGKMALGVGADEVYAGLNGWSLRSPCFEMGFNELERLHNHASREGKCVRVCLNTYPWQADIGCFDRTIGALWEMGIRGFILSDIAMIHRVNRRFPRVEIQASVGADIRNICDVAMLEGTGATSVTLLNPTCDFIRQIRKETTARIEVFAHGYINYTYRARCYMSSYLRHFYGRHKENRQGASGSFNREGYCNRACKCHWAITNGHLLANNVTMNSYPFVAIDRLIDLMKAGINGLKIQGRENSLGLVGEAVALYRRIIDGFERDAERFLIDDETREKAYSIDRRRHKEMRARSATMIREMLHVSPDAPLAVHRRDLHAEVC